MANQQRLSLEEAHRVRNNFRVLAVVSIIYVGIGVVGMMRIENFSFVDSLYFSVVSLTTVGYGDFTPETTAGKFFVMGYLLVGIGIIAAFVNNMLKSVIARRIIKESEQENS